MRKGFLLVATLVVIFAGSAQAVEGQLHGALEITFASKYIWRGFDVYDDHAVIHPSIDLDLFGTGFGFNVTAHRANASGYELNERWDYMIYYQSRFFTDEVYATNIKTAYVYYNYPDRTAHTKASMDLQELYSLFSFPNLLPVEGLVPGYLLAKLMPVNSGTSVGSNTATGGTASGFAHIFMLDYAVPFTCPITGSEQTLNLHTEVIYNDGISPNGATDVDHDWSNALFGISTTMDIGNNLLLTPGIYYQSSWDKSVNTEDEFWTSLTLSYKF